jgi:predicted DsbA family dithiol-disulfide isomerase
VVGADASGVVAPGELGLLDAAAAADLDGADALLASDQLHDEVWSEVESAYQAGVSGVPHFKIDGGGPGRELSGGQPPEAFLRILRSLP